MDLSHVVALLLDMDGTLVDSTAAVDRCWADWARDHGVPAEDVIAVCHGHTAATTMRRFRPDLSDAQIEAQARGHLEREYVDLDGIVALPGAPELLAHLDEAGHPWAVVTNADARLARGRLGAAGITARELVSVDDVPVGKPDPAGYVLAARRLAVEAGRCLVVEDSAPGAAAGRAAGALVALVAPAEGTGSPFAPGAAEPDLRVTDLHELRRLLSPPHAPR